MILEKRVLRIYGPIRKEVTGGLTKLHNELPNLYSSRNIIRMFKSKRMRWARHTERMGEVRNFYKILFGSLERPLGRPRYKWVE
jgi:hypothetical protein